MFQEKHLKSYMNKKYLDNSDYTISIKVWSGGKNHLELMMYNIPTLGYINTEVH